MRYDHSLFRLPRCESDDHVAASGLIRESLTSVRASLNSDRPLLAPGRAVVAEDLYGPSEAWATAIASGFFGYVSTMKVQPASVKGLALTCSVSSVSVTSLRRRILSWPSLQP